MKPYTIIVDLDGTLCNNDHRRHLVENGCRKWDEFYSLMSEDSLNMWCSEIIKRFHSNPMVEITLVTGRPEKHRETVFIWISKHLPDLILPLYMRPDGDFRQDAIVKEEIYKNKIEPYYDVLFCLDDRRQVVEMWRRNGLVCLQCAEGNF
jgi:FMN phosphatase YigB (HAD superfamily)